MTREEVAEVNKILDYAEKVNSVAYKALKKALEQEPCGDAISRQAAINAAIEAADEWDGGGNRNREEIIAKALEQLPSVTPQQKEMT